MPAKRLGAGAISKAERISAAVTTELEGIEKQLDQPIDRRNGVYERVMLESVRPDPKNPRHLNLTWDELKRATDPRELEDLKTRDARKADVIESIIAKAANFRLVGQLQAISVYRDDRGMLRIADGERRYWAARLCEWTEIDARVRSTKPSYLRLEQYSANVMREDLTPGEQFGNLEMIVQEAHEQGTSVGSVSEFASLVGRPRSTMARWWTIIRGPDDVKSALREERVGSLEIAYLAAQEPDAGRRAALLAGQTLPAPQSTGAAVSKRKRAGRPMKGVALGTAKDLGVVRTLIEAVPVDAEFEKTDWSDPRSVQDAWHRFIKAIQGMMKQRARIASEEGK